jgi:hypothetical protein
VAADVSLRHTVPLLQAGLLKQFPCFHNDEVEWENYFALLQGQPGTHVLGHGGFGMFVAHN